MILIRHPAFESRPQSHNLPFYAQIRARRELEIDFRAAIAAAEFELSFQPFVDPATERIAGFEALLRRRRPLRGMISPSDFIPVVEEMGLFGPSSECARAWAPRLRRKGRDRTATRFVEEREVHRDSRTSHRQAATSARYPDLDQRLQPELAASR